MALTDIFKEMTPINRKIVAEVIEKEEKVLASGLILSGEAVNQAMEDMRQKSDVAMSFCEPRSCRLQLSS